MNSQYAGLEIIRTKSNCIFNHWFVKQWPHASWTPWVIRTQPERN
jgi:hypothetical protein